MNGIERERHVLDRFHSENLDFSENVIRNSMYPWIPPEACRPSIYTFSSWITSYAVHPPLAAVCPLHRCCR